MVAEIPKGVYTMQNKLVIINHNAKAYQKASKKIKSQMLKELSEILHMNKQYLASLLRASGKVLVDSGYYHMSDPGVRTERSGSLDLLSE
ncbi:MAG: hypothetical protein ACK4TF_05865 [Thermodesulfovibrionales bacterium]